MMRTEQEIDQRFSSRDPLAGHDYNLIGQLKTGQKVGNDENQTQQDEHD